MGDLFLNAVEQCIEQNMLYVRISSDKLCRTYTTRKVNNVSEKYSFRQNSGWKKNDATSSPHFWAPWSYKPDKNQQ